MLIKSAPEQKFQFLFIGKLYFTYFSSYLFNEVKAIKHKMGLKSDQLFTKISITPKKNTFYIQEGYSG